VKTPRSSISKTAAVIVIVSATAWSSVGVHAQDQTQTQTQVYGHQLMTDAERTAYQTMALCPPTPCDKWAMSMPNTSPVD